MSAMRFENKVMIITGAVQGIGKAVAVSAAKEGAKLVLIDRSPRVETLALHFRQNHCQAMGIEADLEKWESTAKAIDLAHQHFGQIDVLVNNVGGTIWAKPYEAYTPEQIEAEVRRSLFPMLWGCRAVLPHIQQQKQGVIVNVSSVATRGINRVPYSSAKGGVNALTVSLAMENARYGIRINATAPGGTEAPPRLIPRNEESSTSQEVAWYDQVVALTCETSLMHRYGALDEQAAAILFLASDNASYITGTVLPVAGGDLG